MATTPKKTTVVVAKKAPTKAAPVKTTLVAPVAAAPVKATLVAPVAAAPAPVAPKAVPAAKKPSAAKTKLKASTLPTPVLSVEQRNHYVAVAAFYIAERRGFTLGNPANDWMAAEAEVDRLIASGHFIA